jgi:transposase-like protein
LGLWKALRQVFPTTRGQRCWTHKATNVLGELAKGRQPKAKAMPHDIWQAGTKAEAEEAFGLFVATWGAKYAKAAGCLVKGREELLAFYDFPALHWVHQRTANPIESTFATVRLRTTKTKGSRPRSACLTMVFKLMGSAAKNWRLLNGSPLLAKVIAGVRFVDGVEQTNAA